MYDRYIIINRKDGHINYIVIPAAVSILIRPLAAATTISLSANICSWSMSSTRMSVTSRRMLMPLSLLRVGRSRSLRKIKQIVAVLKLD